MSNSIIKLLFSKLLLKIQIPSIRNSEIDKTSRICSACNVVNCRFGKYSYVGKYSTLVNTHVGSFTSISDYCYIGGASHPMYWASMSPVFHSGKNIMNKNFSEHSLDSEFMIEIGNDVWIGSNVLIKPGVIISDGAVIGMGSVVTKNIGPYEIWAGNPAKFIRKRFNDELINKFLQSEWWNLSDETIYKISKNITDVDDFLNSVGEVKNENITLG